MKTFGQKLNQIIELARENTALQVMERIADKEKEGLIINKEIINEILSEFIKN